MLVRHRGAEPSVDPSASVAPTAVVSGDVRIAAGVRILHGAVLSAEDGQVTIGEEAVVMENALIRGRAGHPVHIGSSVMIGPHAHVNGSVVEAEAFIATGASLFPGSRIGEGAEVRVHSVVQVNTHVPAGAVVPIGWVAVGSPATMLPPEKHEEIWAIQRELDFTGTVYGVGRDVSMREIMRRQSAYYGAHSDDEVLDPPVDDSRMLKRLAKVIDEHRWNDLPALLHQDFSCRYVHTGERFDRDAWVRLNAEYPGFQRFVLEDSVGRAERAAGRAHVTADVDGQLQHFEVATFITVRDGLIAEMTEVWTGVDEEAPEGTRPDGPS
ncbi:nuclear transport factor 2 family protein [Leifsonia sp. 2TAF2]|uniref:nuclear transport factor 2 family protein n=1 Tax=Leifsonia sp. 2TAF2 TaxID=3233009 RepID=UPI003F9726EB